MNKLKNFGFAFVASVALLSTPAALAPATVANATPDTTFTMDYAELSFSSAGGADLK